MELLKENIEKQLQVYENEEHEDIPNVILNKTDELYILNERYFRMPAIDLQHKKVRLVETDEKGNYLYEEDGKTIKSDVSIKKFIAHAKKRDGSQ